MRAREPDASGFIERAGVRVGYEVFGEGTPTILLLPTWQIVPSLMWKAQVPFLARHHRVVTYDARGTGRSDRPTEPGAYADDAQIQDAVDVLDATGTQAAVLVGLCSGNLMALALAASMPERVLGWVAMAGGPPVLAPPLEHRVEPFQHFDDDMGIDEGWWRYNRYSWQRDYEGFVRWFADELLPEPHSTKQFEDFVEWGLDTSPDVLLAEWESPSADLATMREWTSQVSCPVLAISGTDDRCQSPRRGEVLAEVTGGQHLLIDGAGHLAPARHPVVVNRAIADFVATLPRVPVDAQPQRWRMALTRQRKALFLCSPIGLGHARRDIAIARALREERPDLEIEWLAQPPVTHLLEAAGETIHPASLALASETAHIDSEVGEHDLHAFQAVRRMDEILVANFMVFDDLVRDEPYDLWVADEAWDVDYFLHENPELKRAPLAWLTDFVGWLPMPEGGDAEAALTTDYNAEMVEHIARFPRLRDASIFVGEVDDVVPDSLGPGLPTIPEWTLPRFDFVGYVTGRERVDRDELRQRLGYAADEKVCVVSVGGSGAGSHLLRRVVDAYKETKNLVPELRMVVVTGPRIDPDSLPHHPDLEVRGFVPDLDLHHAACDIAVVQGGLTTAMELTEAKRPFLYFPLRNHFEQRRHVHHRLQRHRAGRCMEYADADPSAIAVAISEELARPVDYVDVPTDGAAKAAALLSALL